MNKRIFFIGLSLDFHRYFLNFNFNNYCEVIDIKKLLKSEVEKKQFMIIKKDVVRTLAPNELSAYDTLCHEHTIFLVGDDEILEILGEDHNSDKLLFIRQLKDAINNFFFISKEQNIKDKKVDNILTKVFLESGITANLVGYHLLKEAIVISMNIKNSTLNMTKTIYPALAEQYNIKACTVERNIRNAIDVAYNKGQLYNINNFWGYKVISPSEKPTNSQFIAMMADKLKTDIIN